MNGKSGNVLIEKKDDDSVTVTTAKAKEKYRKLRDREKKKLKDKLKKNKDTKNKAPVDLSQAKYEINRSKNNRRNSNKGRGRNRNFNFNKNDGKNKSGTKKFKIVKKDKDKNQNGKSSNTKNIRLERKIHHDNKKRKDKQKKDKAKEKSSKQVKNAKRKRVDDIIQNDTRLTSQVLEFIGDENDKWTAIGNRVKNKFMKSGIENAHGLACEIIGRCEMESVIDLLYDDEVYKVYIQKMLENKENVNGNGNGNGKENENGNGNGQEASDSEINNDNILGGSAENDSAENEENDGIMIHSHTKGMEAIIHETESEEHEDEDIRGHPQKIIERDKMKYNNLDGSGNGDGIGTIHIGG